MQINWKNISMWQQKASNMSEKETPNPSRKKVIFFVTRNLNKFNEARQLLTPHNLSLGMLKLETIEIQSDDLETIAKARAIDAVKKCGLRVIVEDAGLFIEALKGFPGPYASYVYKTIGNQGLLKLMENITMRNSYFESVVAFYGPEEKEPSCFHGKVDGQISREIRGNEGFGFDPVFIPNEGDGRTFAEMKITEKNMLSHRARALDSFARWYKSSYNPKGRF